MTPKSACGLLVVSLSLITVGCQSPGGGTPLSKLHSDGQPQQIAPIGHAQSGQKEQRAVILEKEPVTEDSRWAKLLNPFSARKKRIPLPLSGRNTEPPEESSLAGF